MEFGWKTGRVAEQRRRGRDRRNSRFFAANLGLPERGLGVMGTFGSTFLVGFFSVPQRLQERFW